MLSIKSFTFGPFGTNTFVVSDEKKNAFLIDPACYYSHEQAALYAYLKDFHLTAIVATHGHLDHLWGAPWVCEQWSLPVLMHEADIPMAKAMQQQYDLFGIRATPQPFPMERLESPVSDFQVMETPGHTPGSVCLYHPEERLLFSGDTLFEMGYGRTDLPGGNMAQLITSLEHLFTLPGATQVYPGHGGFTTISAESRGF